MSPDSPARIEASWGEVIDKVTILEIKAERLRGEAALDNVRRELQALGDVARPWLDSPEVAACKSRLREINSALWTAEDEIRAMEVAGRFDADFIAVARSIYQLNDQRFAVKSRINAHTGSPIVEEKSYAAP